MRGAFLALLLTLFSFGSAPEDVSKPDGRMWANFGTLGQQGVFIKAAYVQGAIEGLRVGATVGYLDGQLDEANVVVNYAKQCVGAGGASCSDIAASVGRPEIVMNQGIAGSDKERAKFSPQHTSVLDIVHQMDKFYGDYRNTPVFMITALQEGINSFSGKASTEQELEVTRKVGCNP